MSNNLGVDVILNDLSENPSCEHGPTVLFERYLQNGKKIRYYACSACRDRKLCPFYCNAEEKIKKDISFKQNSFTLQHHLELYERLKEVRILPPKDRFFCQSCASFVTSESPLTEHNSCSHITPIADDLLTVPTRLLEARENPKYESQYLYSRKSVDVLLSLISCVKGKKVLCVGSPRIHEEIGLSASTKLKSFLLDIDKRYASFFPPNQFQLYNLFNHYFFCGEDGRKLYEAFIKGDEPLVVVLDPPFGGRMEMITRTLREIEKDWRAANDLTDDKILPVIFTFPYFLEKTVIENLHGFTMLDYKVDYDNHPLYTTGPKGMKNGSAVRVFVNLPASEFTLPAEEGYSFCDLCRRWVYENNIHCTECGGCMSKDGRTYKHCNSCNRCVKPSWHHCEQCHQCQPQDHKCRDAAEREASAGKCHLCGKLGHKRRECLKRSNDDTATEGSKKRKKNIFLTPKEEKERNLSILEKLLTK